MERWQREAVIRAGWLAYRNGRPRADNPYRHTPNSRAGEFKRAYWEKGWDESASMHQPIPYRITEAGKKALGGGE